MNNISAGLTRALTLSTLILVAGCIATTGTPPIGTVTHRDGRVTDYNGVVLATKGTDNHIRIEGRTYERVVNAGGQPVVDVSGKEVWKQVGPTEITATSGEDVGVKFGTAALTGTVGGIGGGLALGLSMPGTTVHGSTAKAAAGASPAAGTGANAGAVTIQQ